MKKSDHLLVILMEECAEVSKVCAKALRFGLDDIEPGKQTPNRELLNHEMGDLMGAFRMLAEFGLVEPVAASQLDAKISRINKFFQYSRDRKRLE